MIDSDVRNIGRIIEFADDLYRMLDEQGITAEKICTEQFVQWAVTTPLYNIGEFTAHLSKDLKSEHPEIPWSKVAGLRHRLVHDYGGTDWRIIVQVIFEDLPEYVRQVRELLA